jgi:hypothetical protein
MDMDSLFCPFADKVVKLECNTVGKGCHPPPRYGDKLPLNRWTKALKSVVLGRIEAAVLPPPVVGKRSKRSHLPRALSPHRYYVQLNENDLHMLFVPPAFQAGLREWIKIPLPPPLLSSRVPHPHIGHAPNLFDLLPNM